MNRKQLLTSILGMLLVATLTILIVGIPSFAPSKKTLDRQAPHSPILLPYKPNGEIRPDRLIKLSVDSPQATIFLPINAEKGVHPEDFLFGLQQGELDLVELFKNYQSLKSATYQYLGEFHASSSVQATYGLFELKNEKVGRFLALDLNSGYIYEIAKFKFSKHEELKSPDKLNIAINSNPFTFLKKTSSKLKYTVGQNLFSSPNLLVANFPVRIETQEQPGNKLAIRVSLTPSHQLENGVELWLTVGYLTNPVNAKSSLAEKNNVKSSVAKIAPDTKKGSWLQTSKNFREFKNKKIIWQNTYALQYSDDKAKVSPTSQPSQSSSTLSPANTPKTGATPISSLKPIVPNVNPTNPDRSTELKLDTLPGLPTKKITKEGDKNHIQEFVSKEMIIKFKASSIVAAVLDLMPADQPLETLTGDKNLDNLNSQYQWRSSLRKTFSETSDSEQWRQKILNESSKVSELSLRARNQSANKWITKEQAQYLQQKTKEKLQAATSRKDLQKSTLSSASSVPIADSVVAEGIENVYTVRLDSNADIELASLRYAKDSNIEYAQPNYIVNNSEFTPTDPYYLSQNNSTNLGAWGQPYDDMWPLKADKMNMLPAWQKSLGAGVVVAVVDSGVDYLHSDIASNIWKNLSEEVGDKNGDGCPGVCGVDDDGDGLIDEGSINDDDENGFADDIRGWNFVDASAGQNDPMDDNGHGTHVAGTIAAVSNNEGTIGVAPQSKIMIIKGMDKSGSGTIANLSNGILYAANNGAKVINNSWGCSTCPSNPVVEDAVRHAYAKGAVVVFAAGNYSADVKNLSPQNMAETITVGASGHDDKRSTFDIDAESGSGTGIMLDVVAPGGNPAQGPPNFEPFSNILSLRASRSVVNVQNAVNSRYQRLSGTSMATPYVSGLAALIFSKYPSFSNEQVRQAILKGSDDIEKVGFDSSSGYGRINANKSLDISNPLNVIISNPTIQPVESFGRNITIKGSLNGPNFTSGTLALHSVSGDLIGNQISQIATFTTPVNNGVLAVWNPQGITDGEYVLKLTGVNSSGQTFEDRQLISLDNILISNPPPNLINSYRTGDQISIRGTIANSDFSDLDVKIYQVVDGGYSLLSNPSLTFPSGKTTALFSPDSTIAVWNTAGLPRGQYYIQLLVNGYTYYEYTSLYLDNLLNSGWPKNLGNPITSEFKDQISLANLNNDGSKQVIVAKDNLINALDSSGQNIPGWPYRVNTFNSQAVISKGPAIGDLNGDAKQEVVAINSAGELHIIASNGSLLNGPLPIQLGAGSYSVAIDNINGDLDANGKAINEIIITSSTGKVIVIDRFGNPLPGWPITIANGNALTAPAIGNLDGDSSNTKEVIVHSPAGHNLYALSSTGTILPGWPKSIYSTKSYPVLADLDLDGKLEVIVANAVLDQNNPSDIKKISDITVLQANGSVRLGWPRLVTDQLDEIYPPAVGDLNDDGIPEITITSKKFLKVYNTDGVELLSKSNDYASSTSLRMSAPIIGNADSDAAAEIIYYADEAGSSGQETTYGQIHALKINGIEVSGFPIITDSQGPANLNFVTPAIGDMDGDNFLDLFWLSELGSLYRWNLPSPASNANGWGMFAHDAAHTAAAGYPSHKNFAPKLDNIANKIAYVNQPLEFSILARDPNGPNTLNYSALNLPTNASFNSSTKTFSWTPHIGDLGAHSGIIFKASDGEFLDSKEVNIVVRNALTANAGPDQIGQELEPIVFDAAQSFNPNGEITTYEWDFGDGTSSPEVQTRHTFLGNETSYTVKLTVSDGQGGVSTDTAVVTVIRSGLNLVTPLASFQKDKLYATSEIVPPEGLTAGYNFRVIKDGRIVKLGGLFPGTHTVKLWKAGLLVAQSEINSGGSWKFGSMKGATGINLDSVQVKARQTYTVTAFINEGRAGYFSPPPSFPSVFGAVIEMSGMARINGNLWPSASISSTEMYGLADIAFTSDVVPTFTPTATNTTTPTPQVSSVNCRPQEGPTYINGRNSTYKGFCPVGCSFVQMQESTNLINWTYAASTGPDGLAGSGFDGFYTHTFDIAAAPIKFFRAVCIEANVLVTPTPTLTPIATLTPTATQTPTASPTITVAAGLPFASSTKINAVNNFIFNKLEPRFKKEAFYTFDIATNRGQDLLGLRPLTIIGSPAFKAGYKAVSSAISPGAAQCAFINASNNQINPLIKDGENFAITGWIGSPINNTQGTIFGYAPGSGTSRILLMLSEGKLNTEIGSYPNGTIKLKSSVNILDTQWHHFALVLDSKKVSFYIDGFLDPLSQAGGCGSVKNGVLDITGCSTDFFNEAQADVVGIGTLRSNCSPGYFSPANSAVLDDLVVYKLNNSSSSSSSGNSSSESSSSSAYGYTTYANSYSSN